MVEGGRGQGEAGEGAPAARVAGVEHLDGGQGGGEAAAAWVREIACIFGIIIDLHFQLNVEKKLLLRYS